MQSVCATIFYQIGDAIKMQLRAAIPEDSKKCWTTFQDTKQLCRNDWGAKYSAFKNREVWHL